jgi:hypothetical protein
MTEIMSLKIFLMFWSQEKQIFLLLPVDYDISPFLIVKFSNIKARVQFEN